MSTVSKLPEWQFNVPVYKFEFCDACHGVIYSKMWRRFNTNTHVWPEPRVMTFHAKCGKKFRRKNT